MLHCYKSKYQNLSQLVKMNLTAVAPLKVLIIRCLNLVVHGEFDLNASTSGFICIGIIRDKSFDIEIWLWLRFNILFYYSLTTYRQMIRVNKNTNILLSGCNPKRSLKRIIASRIMICLIMDHWWIVAFKSWKTVFNNRPKFNFSDKQTLKCLSSFYNKYVVVRVK